MRLKESDLATALLMERHILKEKYPLACGCVVVSKYGHPARRGWLLISGYVEACPPHNKLYVSFDKENKQEWTKWPFIPKWRDENGLWILRHEWDSATAKGDGVFQYKESLYLLLLGYLGTPVVLGKEKGEKMMGRAITLNLGTGHTFPAPVPEEMLQRFGWVKTEG
jgi:hypothetical protein